MLNNFQAKVHYHKDGLAFQEYNEGYPHLKYTLGYCGRPGGPCYYISSINNKGNHGPGSQGSRTEADSCFGELFSFNGTTPEALVNRMVKQPGKGESGFINKPENFIRTPRVLYRSYVH